VSKRKGSPYSFGRSPHWLKSKNPESAAVRREADEDWGREDDLGARSDSSPDSNYLGVMMIWLAGEFPAQGNREFPDVYQGRIFKETGDSRTRTGYSIAAEYFGYRLGVIQRHILSLSSQYCRI
jgi:hypothetical protein